MEGPGASHYVNVAAVTHVGRVRAKNEDAFVVADLSGGSVLKREADDAFCFSNVCCANVIQVGERGVLLAVSDGMGGAPAGEVASALVIDTIAREIAEDTAAPPSRELLSEAVHRAHEVVRDQGERDQARMGATLTAIFVRAGHAYIAEVGDSRAYLLRGGEIAQVTRDQSMVQLLLDNGLMSREDASHSPMRNVILQAMGHQRDLKIALGRMELRDRDWLIVCSDGLTTHLDDEEIRDIILDSETAELAAACLVALANERGGEDNITVIVANINGALAAPAKDERPEDAVEVLESYDPRIVSPI